MMPAPDHLADDVRFVRSVLASRRGMPAAIALLWALIGVPGFALMDFAPDAVRWYWLVAGPVGFIASIWLGRRDAMLTGEVDRAAGLRWVWHWGGLLAAIAGAVALAMLGVLPFAALDSVALLLIATAYLLAGVHFDRRLLWVAAAFALSFPVSLLIPRYGWTAAGALVAVALVAVAVVAREQQRG